MRGSFCGNGGWLLKYFSQTKASAPPITPMQPRIAASVEGCSPKPFGNSGGMTMKQTSQKCINHAQTARGITTGNASLASMRSNERKGTKKCPKMISIPKSHHDPASRCTYQNVSSGMLAFQMMKYCEK